MFKGLFCWACFRESLFSEGLVIGRNFAFQNGFGLSIKTVTITFHGLIFRRAYYWKDICIRDLGGLFLGELIFFLGGGLIIGMLRYVTIAVELQFKQLRSSPKKRFFGASTAFEPMASATAFALQCSTS